MASSSSCDASVALLASIFEDHPCNALVEALGRNAGKVHQTVEYLILRKGFNEPTAGPSRSAGEKNSAPSTLGKLDLVAHTARKKKRKLSTLDDWLGPSGPIDAGAARASPPEASTALIKSRSPHELGSKRSDEKAQLGLHAHPYSPSASPLLRPISQVLGRSPVPAKPSIPRAKAMTLTAALSPLHLSNPMQISQHLPCCSLFYNILPKQLASSLYLNMIEDSLGRGTTQTPWSRNRWWLNEREVQSPHSTAFFISKFCSEEESLEADYCESAQYWHAGKALEGGHRPRFFLEEMEQARKIVEPVVNGIMNNEAEYLAKAQRSLESAPVERYPQEWAGPWRANVAASNSYKGTKEGVGWHSDQLTYLGPYPTIASLSLGTSRQFRLRSVPNVNEPAPSVPSRTYSLSLPHNSLLIMHGGCQERFKHCAPHQAALDAFECGLSHCQDRHLERINITFRFYRPDFKPTRTVPLLKGQPSGSQHAPTVLHTPRCHCGVPAILRADQKGKVAAGAARIQSVVGQQQAKQEFQFFWCCQAGQQHVGKRCRFFRTLDMAAEQRGPCLDAV